MNITFSLLTSFLLFLTATSLIENNNGSQFIAYSSAVMISSISYWIILGTPTTILSANWLNSTHQQFNISLIWDIYSISFVTVATFVTWCIISFTNYYMNNDPNKNSFISWLLFFLFFMLILVTSNSLFLLFVGWEGVGILSFILIGWWHTRSNANSSALTAIIYNRIGDSGIILFIAIAILTTNSWNLTEIIHLQNNTLLIWGSIGIILASMGKSAQFILHPWLPSAMEGPTPVSALLHSSTMVVAGVFLLLRTHPLISSQSWTLSLLGLIGSLTSLFAASAAISQFDIKKVIAYSTTSQLGLMFVAISLNLPWLALFHICTHAFFKALLFLCSGGIIHSLNNEQDLRNMANCFSHLPLTLTTFIISSLSLSGIPFLSGFYSKDLILEAGQLNTTNSLSIILALIATLLTAAYSLRIIFYLSGHTINGPPINPSSESQSNIIWPYLRLLSGAICSGWGLSLILFEGPPLLIPLTQKSLPLILISISTFWVLNNLNKNLIINNNLLNITFFTNNTWYYEQIWHRALSTSTTITSSLGVLRSLDQGWTSTIGPQGTAHITSRIITSIQQSISGIITNYIGYSLIIGILLLSTSAL